MLKVAWRLDGVNMRDAEGEESLSEAVINRSSDF